MDSRSVLWVALSGVELLGPMRLKVLANLHGGVLGLADAVEAGRLDPTSWSEVRLKPQTLLPRLRAALAGRALARAASHLREWTADGTTLLHPEHPLYPPLLTRIDDPPPLLFLRGGLPEAARAAYPQARTVSVVGTRRSSPWGEAFAVRLARELAEAGVVVVSGLALGIDGAAHRGALEAKDGLTVAVLGSGTGRLHPPVHRTLARRIEDRGALLSEHPPDTAARPAFFPRRNRIVSGLGRAVVVVEAAQPSGASITVGFALDQGRTVFAVPQRPDSALGRGAVELLRQGATPLASARDLLGELAWHPPPSSTASGAGSGAGSDLQRHLLDTLRRLGSGGIDVLAPPGTPAGAVLAALTELEVDGRVRPDGTGGWRTC